MLFAAIVLMVFGIIGQKGQAKIVEPEYRVCPGVVFEKQFEEMPCKNGVIEMGF